MPEEGIIKPPITRAKSHSLPPAPDFLIGSYKLYKHETAAVILHLVGEAKSNGIGIPKRAPTVADTRDESAYLVAVSDIVPLAQRIMEVSKKPTPAVILRTLSRAIASRRRCNAWYQGQSINDASLESSNRSHRHFNDVLDELSNVLTQSHGRQDAEGSGERLKDTKSNPDSIPAEYNPFSVLELDNSDLADQGEEHMITEETKVRGKKPDPKKRSQKGKKPEPPAEYQVEKSTDDIRFMMFNMFKDLHGIRQHLREILARYVACNVSLVRVAAVINSAIGIVRRVETQFLTCLPPQPQFSSWEDIMHLIASSAQFEAISRGLSEDPELDFLYSIYGLPFQQLRNFRESQRTGTFPTYPTGRVPFADSQSQPSKMALRLREMTILNEYFQEIALLGGKETLASEDELTRGIMNTFEFQGRGSGKIKSNSIPLWIVFGLQIFLDTQEILGPNVTQAFREVAATGDIYRLNIEDHNNYSQHIRNKQNSKEQLQKDRHNLDLIVTTWIDRDRLNELRTLRKTSRAGRPFFFLSHNPVVCGVMQCAILVKSQSEAITKLNTSTFGISAAYLYHAVRNEGYLDLLWHNMEQLFDNHGSEEMFLGDRPKSANSYIKHWAIARGYSATNFSSDHLYARPPLKSGKDPRALKVSEIVKTFEELLCQKDATKTDISVDIVERFLHRTAHLQGSQKKRQDALREHWNKDHTLKPIQLLTLLEECLIEEESTLHFNYYAFYKSCFILLSAIEYEFHDDFRTWLSRLGPIENMSASFNQLPAFIFVNFALQSKGKLGPSPNNILVRLAGVFKKFIGDHASEPSRKTVGVIDDDNLRTETEHGTQNDLCIHWGSCERLAKGT